MVGEEVHSAAAQVFRIWHFLLSLIPFCKKLLTAQLLREWEKHFVERWGAAIFRETLTKRARLRVVSTSLSEHQMISRTVRSQSTFKQLEPPPLQNTVDMVDPKEQAVIFEQSYNLHDDQRTAAIRLLDDDRFDVDIQRTHKSTTATSTSSESVFSAAAAVDAVSESVAEHDCTGKHLFVLVHGYQGNSWDMRMFRNRLLVKCPDDVFLMSESNEAPTATEGDIAKMGQRLAAEIVDAIDAQIVSQQKV